ncbi:MAG: hypothetical protein ACI9O4_002383 [Chitinophagales bacterium]|jgi:uncharacterized protein YndB with AHSA1/START domain
MEAIILAKQVQCSTKEAFDYWTKPKQLQLFFGANHQVELPKGGPYEIYFSMEPAAGQRGSEGCQVIDFKADEFLSFTWNAPPSIPEIRNSNKYTNVKLSFNSINAHSCELKLVHDGWNYGGKGWGDTHQFFQEACPYLLNNMEQAIKQINTPLGDEK